MDVIATTTTTITMLVDENRVSGSLVLDSDMTRLSAGGLVSTISCVGNDVAIDVGSDDGDVGLDVGCEVGPVGFRVGC